MTHRTVGIEQARKVLGELIDAAQHGQLITITRHGRPVATLTAITRKEPAGDVRH